MQYLFLRVTGRSETPLGVVSEPADVPELLRHVADFYDDNPDECVELLNTPLRHTASAPALSFGTGFGPA